MQNFNLPIYSPDTPILWTHEEIAAIGNLEAPTAVRAAKLISAMRGSTLESTLHTADTAFATIAAYAGVSVVKHTWGITPITDSHPDSIQNNYRSALLPHDHALVAEVDVIKDAAPLDDESRARVNNAIFRYFQHTFTNAWTDAHASSFVTGYGPGEDTKQIWLVNIEPRLGPRSLYRD